MRETRVREASAEFKIERPELLEFRSVSEPAVRDRGAIETQNAQIAKALQPFTSHRGSAEVESTEILECLQVSEPGTGEP